MDYTRLSEVDKTSQNWTIKVRVVRFSELMKLQEPTKRQRIDLILIDEEGNTMEGQVPEVWHSRSKTVLKEGSVYKIRYFRVVDAKASYRPVPSDYLVQFTPYTKIEEIPEIPVNFPLYAHHAVPFAELHTRINNDRVTSDVVAVITGCSVLKQQPIRNGGVKTLRNLTLTDGSDTLSVALWGKHAERFEADGCVNMSREGSVVILLCAMTCRVYNEKLSLHSSMLCRWYVNPQMQEADALRQQLPDVPVEWLSVPQPLPETETATVRELASVTNPQIIHDKRYTVTAKIISISTKETWWYLACISCNKKIYENGDSYRCNRPNCTSTTGKARYRLSVKAVDPDTALENYESQSIGLVFFGPQAEQVVGCPVQDLLGRNGGLGVHMPKEINAVCGKVCTMRVSVGVLSYQDITLSYQVMSIVGNVRRSDAFDHDMPATQGTPKDRPLVVEQTHNTNTPPTPAITEAASKKRDAEGTVKSPIPPSGTPTPGRIVDLLRCEVKGSTELERQEALALTRVSGSAKRVLDFGVDGSQKSSSFDGDEKRLPSSDTK